MDGNWGSEKSYKDSLKWIYINVLKDRETVGEYCIYEWILFKSYSLS